MFIKGNFAFPDNYTIPDIYNSYFSTRLNIENLTRRIASLYTGYISIASKGNNDDYIIAIPEIYKNDDWIIYYNFGSDNSPKSPRNPLFGAPSYTQPGGSGGSGPRLFIPEGLLVAQNVYYGNNGLTLLKSEARKFKLSEGNFNNINFVALKEIDVDLGSFIAGGFFTSKIDISGGSLPVKITLVNTATLEEKSIDITLENEPLKYRISTSIPGEYYFKYKFNNQIYYLNNGYLTSDDSLANKFILDEKYKSNYTQDVYYENIFPSQARGQIVISEDFLPSDYYDDIKLSVCDINGKILNSYTAHKNEAINIISPLSKYYLVYEIKGYKGYVGTNNSLSADFNNLQPFSTYYYLTMNNNGNSYYSTIYAKFGFSKGLNNSNYIDKIALVKNNDILEAIKIDFDSDISSLNSTIYLVLFDEVGLIKNIVTKKAEKQSETINFNWIQGKNQQIKLFVLNDKLVPNFEKLILN